MYVRVRKISGAIFEPHVSKENIYCLRRLLYFLSLLELVTTSRCRPLRSRSKIDNESKVNRIFSTFFRRSIGVEIQRLERSRLVHFIFNNQFLFTVHVKPIMTRPFLNSSVLISTSNSVTRSTFLILFFHSCGAFCCKLAGEVPSHGL